jgi:hypothetical protein
MQYTFLWKKAQNCLLFTPKTQSKIWDNAVLRHTVYVDSNNTAIITVNYMTINTDEKIILY